jgi:hypothetical protein
MDSRLWKVLVLALIASCSTGIASGQASPLQLVQVTDGAPYVITDDARHRIVPALISDEEPLTIPKADAWGNGVMTTTAPEAAGTAVPATTPGIRRPRVEQLPPAPTLPPFDPTAAPAPPVACGRHSCISGRTSIWQHDEADQHHQGRHGARVAHRYHGQRSRRYCGAREIQRPATGAVRGGGLDRQERRRVRGEPQSARLSTRDRRRPRQPARIGYCPRAGSFPLQNRPWPGVARLADLRHPEWAAHQVGHLSIQRSRSVVIADLTP